MFFSWKSSLNTHCLFFDGVAKGNPGQAGCGGMISLANGDMNTSYSWGLGTESNNIAEFCGLLQGLKLALSKRITKLSVFGDSKMLIQALNWKKRPNHLRLTQIYHKIRHLSKKFHSISFYHVLRALNSLADKAANQGTLLGRGVLVVDGDEDRCDIP